MSQLLLLLLRATTKISVRVESLPRAELYTENFISVCPKTGRCSKDCRGQSLLLLLLLTATRYICFDGYARNLVIKYEIPWCEKMCSFVNCVKNPQRVLPRWNSIGLLLLLLLTTVQIASAQGKKNAKIFTNFVPTHPSFSNEDEIHRYYPLKVFFSPWSSMYRHENLSHNIDFFLLF